MSFWDKVVAFFSDLFSSPAVEEVQAPPPSSVVSIIKIYKKNDRGPMVGFIQTKLNLLGYGLKVDDWFGVATESAVKAFQKKRHLQESGVVDPAVMKLIEAITPRVTVPTPIRPPVPPATESGAPQYWKPLVIEGVSVHPLFAVPAPYTHLHPIDVHRSVAGQQEIAGSRSNVLIAHFHEHAGNLGVHSDKNDYSDEVPHCASAQNWAQDGAGCFKSDNALASSYEKYAAKHGSKAYKKGDTIPEGAIICIDGHVTRANKQFRWTGSGTFEGFGANQSNSSGKTSSYSQSRIRTICDDAPKPGTVLAPIGILGMKPLASSGDGDKESTV